MKIATIEDIRSVARPILKKSPARKAVVFGSWARGTQTRRSDIDMMIVSDQAAVRFFDRYNDFEALYDALGSVGLDLLIYTEKELTAMMERPFIRSVLQEGVLVYER